MPPMTPAQFFGAAQFAVVGASTNTEKFGYKVFSWYIDHSIPAVPINPSPNTKSILDRPTVAALSELTNPKETSVSVITPPKISLQAVEDAKKLGIKGLWFQPGSFDEAVLKKAEELGVPFVAGGGACVLIHGERAIQEAKEGGAKL
ncbi:NAD(P)-binding protein [Ascodesmis nigricans]|uniref:NAD(P)-binding protein n=1 Tax=Ascodesmis nigricans TaxID=341454 RepID=A0A4S2N8X0_9PEZI|nr:NAD(P)-binding protein [Ascodesmis nigricans]